MADSLETVLFEKINGVGIITLNKPKVLNAIDLTMIRKIFPKLLEWEKDSQVKMVYIKGEGNKAFCAGGDVKAVTESAQKNDFKLGETFFREEYLMNHKIGSYKKPYIAMINGITMGGGVGLSLLGAYRIATEKTDFAMPETAIGLFPDVGASYFLPKLPHNLGLYLGLTGQRLKGHDVYKANIATHIISSEKISSFEKELLSLPHISKTSLEDLLKRYNYKDLESQTQPKLNDKTLPLINKLFDPKSFTTKISGVPSVSFEGFRHNLIKVLYQNMSDEESMKNTILGKAGPQLLSDPDNVKQDDDISLNTLSPTSLKLTFKLLCDSTNGNWDLNACLIHEYRLSCRLLRHNDFIEGVRAVLVDKDNKPKWKPSTLAEVKDSDINKFFEPFTPVENIEELKILI
ncbi:unnamed protein product [Gordionus sp. m RMFG-2023]